MTGERSVRSGPDEDDRLRSPLRSALCRVPCGTRGSRDGTARIWRWRRLAGPVERTVLSIEHQADGASAEHGQAVSMHGGAKPPVLWIDMVTWSADGCLAFTAESVRKQVRDSPCISACVRVWSASGALLHTLGTGTHAHQTFVLHSHPLEPAYLGTASYDGQLRIWDARRGSLVRTERAPEQQRANAGEETEEERLVDGGFSPTGDVFAATGESGALVLMRFGSRRRDAPAEQFFGSDYNQLAHDASGNALDTTHNVHPILLFTPPIHTSIHTFCSHLRCSRTWRHARRCATRSCPRSTSGGSSTS